MERIVPDGSDVCANCDAGQIVAVIKRISSNGCDGQAIGRAGNGHRTAGTGVLVDVERAVVIGRENELGLHYDR